MELQFNIKVMNNLTGEISDVKVESAQQAANLVKEFKASKTALDRAIKTINNQLDNWLANDSEQHLPDGTVVRRVQRNRTQWTKQALRQFLDDEQLELITTVNKTEAKKMLSELIEAGHINPRAVTIVEEQAESLPMSPFVEVK